MVLVIAGIVIAIVATVLPALIQSGKNKQTDAMLERATLAMDGYLATAYRLPCPDVDGDGQEDLVAGDCSAYVGDIPYLTVGLFNGNDAWGNPLRYSVFGLAGATEQDLTNTFSDADDLCTNTLGLGSIPAVLDNTRLFVADDSANSNAINQAYVLASGGVKDRDGAGGFYDDLNGDATPLRFNKPNKIELDTYDDRLIAVGLSTLKGNHCDAGGGGGGGGGSGSGEVCNVAGDEDNDGFADCYDQECYGKPGPPGDPNLDVNGFCPASAPTGNVQINTTAMPNGTLGNSYAHTYSATGGSGSYYWYLDSVTPAISGLGINLWTGQLSGILDVCDGSYSLDVRVEDRFDSAKTDSHTFTLTVDKGSLSITPAPAGVGTPDFTVDSSTFAQTFAINGTQVGPFNWTANWNGNDPGGFQIDTQSDNEGNFWKSGSTTVGSYVFSLTATDNSCSGNTYTSGYYSISILPAALGSPYSENMVGEWLFDECSWTGVAGEVEDGSTAGTGDGTAENRASTIGSGHICRAGWFDGRNDYVDLGNESGSPDLNTAFSNSSSAFTVAMWVNPSQLENDRTNHRTRNTVFAKASDRYGDNLEIGINTNGTVHVYVNTVARDAYSDFGAENSVPLDAWTFIAVTYDNGTVAVTINDTRYENTSTWSGATVLEDVSGSSVTVGSSQHVNNYFTGRIDEVRVWSKALDASETAEVKALTRSSCSGTCYTDSVAEYQMELDYPWDGTVAGEVNDSAGSNSGIAARRGSGAIPTQTSPSQGKICRAGSFVRVNSSNGGYLDLGDPASGDLDPGESPWTISAWFNWDGSSDENIIYNKESLYEARVRNGQVRYAWRPHWNWDGGSSFPVSANTWYHITTVYDGHEQILYKDGEQVFARSESGSMGTNSRKFLIGARGHTSPRNFFGGMIDEVRIYNRALSESEIGQLVTDTRDCGADTVIITGITPSTVTIGDTLAVGTGIMPSATGGTLPYVWQLISSDIPGLSMPNVSTGELVGNVDVCAGTRTVTLRATDAIPEMDERIFDVTVQNGTLSTAPASTVINCSASVAGDCQTDFTVSGPRLGEMDSWSIEWQGGDPGSFSITKTGANTARFTNALGAAVGSGYRFKLTAVDATCADNAMDTGFSYTINIGP